MTQQPLNPLDQQILDLLKTGDRTQGELRDATGVTYPVLYSSIARLVRTSLVEHHFAQDTVPALSYRLIQPTPALRT